VNNFFKYKDSNISYEVKGKGRAVVLLHGFLEDKNIWKITVDDISKSYKTIVIDLPGHGKSECIGYIHTMEMMADLVKKLMDSLNLRKYVVLGHSMGGYVSMAIAEMFPDNIKGIGLIHSTAAGDNENKKKDRNKLIKLLKKNKNLDLPSIVIPGLFRDDTNTYINKQKNLYIKRAKKISARALIACLEGMKDRTEREIILKFAPYPVLFIAGKHDKLIPWEKTEEQSLMPRHSTFVILENAGHMGQIEDKYVFANAIKTFLHDVYKPMKKGKRKLTAYKKLILP
jgi:pimeloyl-ACP methyl ester carboxylesterase